MNCHSMKVKTMIPMSNGIFTHINYQFPQVFEISQQQLDMLFVANYGMRSVSPIVRAIHDNGDTQLTDEELTRLGQLTHDYFKRKWDKLADAALIEYDPIHNYSDEYHEELTETIEGNDTQTHNTTITNNETLEIDRVVTDGGLERRTESNTALVTDGGEETHETEYGKRLGVNESVSKSETHDIDETVTRTDNLSESDTNANNSGIYGFNSNVSVGANTNNGTLTKANTGTQETVTDGTNALTGSEQKTRSDTESGTDTLTITGGLTESTTGSKESTIQGGLTRTTDDDQVTQGTKRTTGTEATDKSSERTRGRDFTHLGNIGNLSTQQLLREEIELWRWNFVEQVLSDVKDFLTIPMYI